MLAPLPDPVLPQTLRTALLRGIRGRCPRCGEAKLFGKFLKPIAICPRCHHYARESSGARRFNSEAGRGWRFRRGPLLSAASCNRSLLWTTASPARG